MAKSRDTDYLCHNGLSLAFTRHGCAMLLQVDIIKEQPMKPFARISLSAAALRRGSGKCENVQLSNIQYPLFNDGGASWILAVGCWIFAHFHISLSPYAERRRTS